MTPPLQTQVGGDHYQNLAIQPALYCQKNHLGFMESCAVKYITRHKLKGQGKQDLEKAIHCLQLLIEMEYPDVPAKPVPEVPTSPQKKVVRLVAHRSGFTVEDSRPYTSIEWTASNRCPECDKLGVWRSGQEFDHMMRCCDCSQVWVPETIYNLITFPAIP